MVSEGRTAVPVQLPPARKQWEQGFELLGESQSAETPGRRINGGLLNETGFGDLLRNTYIQLPKLCPCHCSCWAAQTTARLQLLPAKTHSRRRRQTPAAQADSLGVVLGWWWPWTSQFGARRESWAQGWSGRRCCVLTRRRYLLCSGMDAAHGSPCDHWANSSQKHVCIPLHKALSDVNDSSISGLVLVKSLLMSPSFPSLPAPAQPWVLFWH